MSVAIYSCCYIRKRGLNMDVNQVIQIVSTLGFPIVMCGAMAWYVYHISETHRKDATRREEEHRQEVEKLNERHKEEMEKVTEAINNNTLALTKLCERMDK